MSMIAFPSDVQPRARYRWPSTPLVRWWAASDPRIGLCGHGAVCAVRGVPVGAGVVRGPAGPCRSWLPTRATAKMVRGLRVFGRHRRAGPRGACQPHAEPGGRTVSRAGPAGLSVRSTMSSECASTGAAGVLPPRGYNEKYGLRCSHGEFRSGWAAAPARRHSTASSSRIAVNCSVRFGTRRSTVRLDRRVSRPLRGERLSRRRFRPCARFGCRAPGSRGGKRRRGLLGHNEGRRAGR
jgi:hypothetical protein